MKRNNPDTKNPFKSGEKRSDGRVFYGYQTNILLKTGYFAEQWVTLESWLKRKYRTAKWKKDNPKEANNWQRKNPEKVKKLQRNWEEMNRERRNAINAKRRSNKLKRTPPWLTEQQIAEISCFYSKAKLLEAQTGIKHHVDHIVPLQGENVSGLHVPWNLQILTQSDNCSKGNFFNNTQTHTQEHHYVPI